MRAALHSAPVLQQVDAVGLAHGGQAVGDDDDDDDGASVSLSTALMASSSTSTGGFFRMAPAPQLARAA
jgi:hypothetical protein